MARLLVVLSCLLASLGGCILLGPGANDDDDTDTEDSSNVHVGGGSTFLPPTAGSGAQPAVTGWSCFEGTSMCMCTTSSVGSSISDGRCQYDWDCCVHTPSANECRCFTSVSCAAEVASMPGAAMVATCPPNAADVPEACAAESENCGYDYLEERDLNGCCDGLVCKPNAQNVRVCQPGSEAEQVAEAQCLDERNADGLTVEGALATSGGDLSFTVAESTLARLSASGCPLQIPLALTIGSDPLSTAYCSLRLTAGPDRDEAGRLIVHDLNLFAETFGIPCPGFPPAIQGLYMQGGATAGTLAFEGASCELSFGNEVCVAGRMLLTLDATLTGTSISTSDPSSEPVSVTFEAASVELDGRICDSLPAMTACPAQP